MIFINSMKMKKHSFFAHAQVESTDVDHIMAAPERRVRALSYANHVLKGNKVCFNSAKIKYLDPWHDKVISHDGVGLETVGQTKIKLWLVDLLVLSLTKSSKFGSQGSQECPCMLVNFKQTLQ